MSKWYRNVALSTVGYILYVAIDPTFAIGFGICVGFAAWIITSANCNGSDDDDGGGGGGDDSQPPDQPGPFGATIEESRRGTPLQSIDILLSLSTLFVKFMV